MRGRWMSRPISLSARGWFTCIYVYVCMHAWNRGHSDGVFELQQNPLYNRELLAIYYYYNFVPPSLTTHSMTLPSMIIRLLGVHLPSGLMTYPSITHISTIDLHQPGQLETKPREILFQFFLPTSSFSYIPSQESLGHQLVSLLSSPLRLFAVRQLSLPRIKGHFSSAVLPLLRR